jgi:hypothetical protein
MAGKEGIEPSHDGVKVRCLTAWRLPNRNFTLSQSNLACKWRVLRKWQGQQDLNPRHSVLETDVLPAELCPYSGAGNRSRTRDLLITSQLLYQLSYTGMFDARVNITHRSHSCQLFCFVRPNEMYLITDVPGESILFFIQKTRQRCDQWRWCRSCSLLHAICSRSSCRSPPLRIS